MHNQEDYIEVMSGLHIYHLDSVLVILGIHYAFSFVRPSTTIQRNSVPSVKHRPTTIHDMNIMEAFRPFPCPIRLR